MQALIRCFDMSNSANTDFNHSFGDPPGPSLLNRFQTGMDTFFRIFLEGTGVGVYAGGVLMTAGLIFESPGDVMVGAGVSLASTATAAVTIGLSAVVRHTDERCGHIRQSLLTVLCCRHMAPPTPAAGYANRRTSETSGHVKTV